MADYFRLGGPIQPGGTLDSDRRAFFLELVWLVMFALGLILVAVFVLSNLHRDPPRSTDFTCTTNSAGIACTSQP